MTILMIDTQDFLTATAEHFDRWQEVSDRYAENRKMMDGWAPQRSVDLNSSREVAIDRAYKWNRDMTAAPRGVKLQLLGAGGVAHYGQYDGKGSFWRAWAPLPSN